MLALTPVPHSSLLALPQDDIRAHLPCLRAEAPTTAVTGTTTTDAPAAATPAAAAATGEAAAAGASPGSRRRLLELPLFEALCVLLADSDLLTHAHCSVQEIRCGGSSGSGCNADACC